MDTGDWKVNSLSKETLHNPFVWLIPGFQWSFSRRVSEMFVERKITALTKAMCQIFPIRICFSRIWVRLFCFFESISSTLQQQLPAWYPAKRESHLDVNFPVILTSRFSLSTKTLWFFGSIQRKRFILYTLSFYFRNSVVSLCKNMIHAIIFSKFPHFSTLNPIFHIMNNWIANIIYI